LWKEEEMCDMSFKFKACTECKHKNRMLTCANCLRNYIDDKSIRHFVDDKFERKPKEHHLMCDEGEIGECTPRCLNCVDREHCVRIHASRYYNEKLNNKEVKHE
jgi:hypothetical protein